MRYIVLDSTPLGLVCTKLGNPAGDQCRAWAKERLSDGMRFIVPEVVDYELRRELLRLGNVRALSQLDAFILAEHDRYLALTTRAMRLAAELWARSRRQGMPTADPHALDIDVLLSAQILSHSVARSDFVVATSNVAHLSLFVPAKSWNLI